MAGRGETLHASRARRRRTILRAVAVVVLLGALTYLFVFSRHGYLRRRELARENERLQHELDQLQAENVRLREELESLDDPEAVEKLAREKLGLVREGETVYRFVEKDKNRKNAEEKAAPPKP
ncbi:MAG: septum formation initiator family protein [Candidatus Coatesbacteria bacterium]|nr:MAG: septum formation initiator family protein [Candidatus Coatesbacteria bacterium]